jgi:large subunit ribosomal protein L22
MRYSYNQNKEEVVFANMKDINASHKDLGAVCDAIRYRSVKQALDALDNVIINKKPILFRRHNKNMGSRHELGGKKGRTPIKCAKIVRRVLVNAAANARNKELEPDLMYVIHASANKTMIATRFPSKGALYVSGGTYGQITARHSNLEFARVEIGISTLDEKRLGKNTVSRIKAVEKAAPKIKIERPKKRVEKKEEKKEKKPLVRIEKKESAPEQKKEQPKPIVQSQPQTQQLPQQQTKPATTEKPKTENQNQAKQ